MSSLSELQATPGVCASPDPATQGFVFQQVGSRPRGRSTISSSIMTSNPCRSVLCVNSLSGARTAHGTLSGTCLYACKPWEAPTANETRRSRNKPCHPLASERTA